MVALWFQRSILAWLHERHPEACEAQCLSPEGRIRWARPGFTSRACKGQSPTAAHTCTYEARQSVAGAQVEGPSASHAETQSTRAFVLAAFPALAEAFHRCRSFAEHSGGR